jgi:ATP synthase mitochondrial F1 complex assembly factor 2
MKPAARLSMRALTRLVNPIAPSRSIHSTVVKPANVAPILGTGPPPEAPPAPAAVNAYHRAERRRKQAELLKNAKHLRDVESGKVGGMLRKRFWKNVSVREVDGECFEIVMAAHQLRRRLGSRNFGKF